MDKVTFLELETMAGFVEYALIDRGNNEFTSMIKADYDRQQAEQSTPSLTDEAATK
jgi:hypothetical protein